MSVAATSLSIPARINSWLPSRDEIKQIALRALGELAVALALTVLCFPFLASASVAIALLGVSVLGVAINAGINLAHKLFFQQNSVDCFVAKSICSGNFYRFSGTNAMIVAHESGHFLAAKTLFQGTAKIRLVPFIEGWTSYATRSMTLLGKMIGYRNSIFLITLAGPVLALTVAAIALFAGYKLRHSHENISAYLLGIGLLEFASHALYAGSALSAPQENLGHDFVRLKTFGIPPMAAVATIVAIPIILLLGLFFLDKPEK